MRRALHTTPRFQPPFWLANPHVQTILPQLLGRPCRLDLVPERVELADGDFIDLAWAAQARGPGILLLHGLQGSLRSHYVQPTMEALIQAGYKPVFMHLRGCSDTPNRLARTYHSGSSDDLAQILAHCRAMDRPLAGAIGFSLGANILLKYLGETGDQANLSCALAVSPPFRLAEAGRQLERGLARIYQHYLVSRLKKGLGARQQARMPAVDLAAISTLRQFDDQITAPLNGFSDADDYYRRCSCSQYLASIRRPTLILHAKDDPFMHPDDPPTPQELSAAVRLLLLKRGGHVGFLGQGPFWRPRSLLSQLVPDFFGHTLATTGPGRPA